MKNIIFISNYFGNGGAATVMKTLIEKLPKNKYNIKLITFLDDEEKYKIPNDIEYITLSPNIEESKIEKIKKIFKLRKILKNNKKAIIISFEYFVNMQTILANWGLKNKLIISERNDPSSVGNRRKHIRNFLYNFADVLVCQTPEAKAYFPKNIQKKSTIIPNPIKNDLPTPWKETRKKEIVNFCRLEKQKNIPLLIDAFEIFHQKYPDYKLIIYGDGKEKENIKNYIKTKLLNESIILHPSTKNIHEKVLKSKIFVSSSDYEGLSNSMIEAMAIGIPTICTDCPCGGARMIIKNKENGILVPVNDKNKLASAMIEIVENDKLAKKISINGEKIKDELKNDKICQQWLKHIENNEVNICEKGIKRG